MSGPIEFPVASAGSRQAFYAGTIDPLVPGSLQVTALVDQNFRFPRAGKITRVLVLCIGLPSAAGSSCVLTAAVGAAVVNTVITENSDATTINVTPSALSFAAGDTYPGFSTNTNITWDELGTTVLVTVEVTYDP